MELLMKNGQRATFYWLRFSFGSNINGTCEEANEPRATNT